MEQIREQQLKTLMLLEKKAEQNMGQEMAKKQVRGVKFLAIKNALYGLKEDVKRYLENKDSLINKLENH